MKSRNKNSFSLKSRDSEPREIKTLRKSAQKGDVAAQYQLGWKYANGRGVAQSDKEAAYWYGQAIAKDPTNAVAQFQLGWLYANGRGMIPDLKRAVELYSAAANGGNVSAQFHLGLMYFNGEGTDQDEALALEWLRKAAAQGDEPSKALVKRMEKKSAEQKQIIAGVFEEKIKEKKEAKKLTTPRKATLRSMNWTQKNGEGDNLFHTAAMYKKRPETFKNLLEMVPANMKCGLLKETNSEGNTPLHLLAYGGQVDLIKETIATLGREEAKLILNSYNTRGYLPIHEAAESGEFEAIKALIEAGADANALTKNGLTVAQCAAQKGYCLLAEELNKPLTTAFSSPTVNSPQISLGHSGPSFPRKLNENCIDDQGTAKFNLAIPYNEVLKMGPLGAGSFATVHRGRHKGRDVAIKKLLDKPLQGTLINEMYREAGIMFQLPHPNIVRLYGIVLEPECCIVLEFMQNGSLYMLLQSEDKLSWKKRYEIVTDIANGLAYLHENEIVHRDLKSLNVLLDKYNQAKISDFGLSRIASFNGNDSEQQAPEGTAQAKANKIGKAGTVPWIAPELFQGQEYTSACDVYSFGMVIWEIITRRVPYEHIAATELIAHWVQKGNREEILKEAPEVLRELTLICWAGDPAMRPSMEAALEKLSTNPVEDTAPLLSSPHSLPLCEEENSCLKPEEGSILTMGLAKEQAPSDKSSGDEQVGLSSESVLTIASSPTSNEILPSLGREAMKKSTAPGTPGFFTPITMGERCGLRRNPTPQNEVRENLTLGETEFFSKPVQRGYGLSQSQDIIRRKQKTPEGTMCNYIISSFSSQEYTIKEKEEAIAKEAYRTIKPGNLSFSKGAKLTILDKTDPKQWLCELNGKKGFVPSKHMNIIKPDVQSGTSRYIMGSGY